MWTRAALALLLLVPGGARASACCIASTSAVPTELGAWETWLAGAAVAAEGSVGRWDAAGAVTPSSLQDRALVGSLGVARRLTPRLQLGATLPLRVSRRVAGDLEAWGGGPGDLSVIATWDPFDEPPAREGGVAAPVPVFTVGVRAPTGRSWKGSHAPLLADVTGLPGWGIQGAARMERSLGSIPWSLGVDADLPVAGQGTPPLLGASGAVGRYLGSRWTVLLTARHALTLPDATAGRASTSRTTVGARAIRGERVAWRAWAGLEADLPVDHLGRSSMQMVRGSVGVAVVR